MLKNLLNILFVFSCIFASAQKLYKYAPTSKGPTINHYFDSAIYDPYQWMENPNDPRLQDWLETQKNFTEKQGNKASHFWTLRTQIATMYTQSSEELKEGYIGKKDQYKSKYEFKTNYTNYSKTPDLLYRLRGRGDNYKLLIRIKDFRHEKGENVVVTNQIVDEESDIVAIEMSRSGGDWREVYFFDLIQGKQLLDTLKHLRIGSHIIWNKNGVYYDRYDKPEEGRELLNIAKGQALYYHKLGTPQAEDKLLYKNPDESGTNYFRYANMNDEKLFFHHLYYSKEKTYKALSSATLNGGESFVLKHFLIYPNEETIAFGIEALFGDTVILYTNWNAPNGKVLASNINEVNKLIELIPEYDIRLRETNKLGKDKLACIYRKDGKFMVLIFDLKGKLLKKIDYPEGKKVRYFYENNQGVDYTDFCISSFYHPDIWYQLSLNDLSIRPRETVWIPYDAKDLETNYVKYTSKDGTEVPMYITKLKSTKLNGKNPTILYGYGGYGITVEPKYDRSQTLWLLHGGILAIPNIRGGGAEGSEWALAGRRLKKKNTIADFIAAAEYLISENYTNPEKLGINGGSHGGLLVGAAITQRPDLFKAAIIEAGVLDLLRFEKYTIGATSTSINEFGITTNYDDFLNMKSYSPMHNIKKDIKYPNTLVITGDSDDRVPPFHSYKFLTTLQEKGSAESLFQLYLIPGAGHGGGLTPQDAFDKLLFKYDFMFNQLGLKFW